jgi:hypothetical protein
VRVQAANILLDRGWGKPAQTHTAEDDEGKVTVIIRHLVESRDEARDAKMIDASPVRHGGGREGTSICHWIRAGRTAVSR